MGVFASAPHLAVAEVLPTPAPRVSLNLQAAEVRSVLRLLAEAGGANLVLSEGVHGTVSLRLRDVPWDQALQSVLQSRGLGSVRVEEVLWVAPRAELHAREQADMEARRRLADLEPTVTRAFQLNFSKAEEVARGLMGQGIGGSGSASTPGPAATAGSSAAGGPSGSGSAAPARILSPRGSVIPVARTNQLFVTDIPARLDQVRDLIARIDIPVRQVQIEARIVQASDSFSRALGAKLQAGSAAAPAAAVRPVEPGWNVPATAIGGAEPAVLALSILGPSATRMLSLELSALEADGRGKIVSSPRLVTADQVEAFVKQGFRVPYRGSTSGLHGSPAVQFQEANLKLTVTPQITPDGQVLMTVHVNKDSLGAVTPDGREINTREIRTQVLVDDGGTVVIGGIYEDEQSDLQTGVPGLARLPWVGALFRSHGHDARRTELLIFLTPHILIPPQPNAAERARSPDDRLNP